jgi:hypothetical protein
MTSVVFQETSVRGKNGKGPNHSIVADTMRSRNVLSQSASIGTVNLSGSILAPNGTQALPSYSFTSNPDSGMYLATGGNEEVRIADNGAEVMRFRSSGGTVTVVRIGNDVASTSTTLSLGQSGANTAAFLQMNGPVANSIVIGTDSSTGLQFLQMRGTGLCHIEVGTVGSTSSHLTTRQAAKPVLTGTAATKSILTDSTDLAGQISATDDAAALRTLIVTYRTAYNAAVTPHVILSPATKKANDLQTSTAYTVVSTPTEFTVTYTGVNDAAVATWDYHVIGGASNT